MPHKIPTYRPRAAVHAAKAYEQSDARRADQSFYNGVRWRRLRQMFLNRNPLCVDCSKAGRLTPASQAHHIEERKDRPELAYEWDNLESVCLSCHNAKRGKRHDDKG